MDYFFSILPKRLKSYLFICPHQILNITAAPFCDHNPYFLSLEFLGQIQHTRILL